LRSDSTEEGRSKTASSLFGTLRERPQGAPGLRTRTYLRDKRKVVDAFFPVVKSKVE